MESFDPLKTMSPERSDSATFGNRTTLLAGRSNPIAVIIPPGAVHAFKNVGHGPAIVVNLPDRLHGGHGRRDPIDEIRHEDRPDCPFLLA